MRWRTRISGIVAAALALGLPNAASAQVRPSVAYSFRVGSGGDALCRAELIADDKAASGLFDRAYALVCRDAATAIGHLYVIRGTRDAAVARVAETRKQPVKCADAAAQTLDIGVARRSDCIRGDGVSYVAYSFGKGRNTFVGEGLTGYRSALELALRSLVVDRVLDGKVEIAITDAGDPAAFARAQAGSLDRDRALVEGYRRNNAGSFAEASEFFDTLFVQADAASGKPGEYLINQALQLSNLGEFDRADALFAQALTVPTNDPVELRLRRNYLAIHRLNQRDPAAALVELDRPVAPSPPPPLGATIDLATARMLNDGARVARGIGLADSEKLTPGERAALLDAQALALRGAAARRQGRTADAQAALKAALTGLDQVRMGRVVSTAPVRAQILTDQAALAEAAGDRAAAAGLLQRAIDVLIVQYPGSPAVTVARARLAAYLARTGQSDAAIALYREVIAALGQERGATAVSTGSLLEPYFDLLTTRADTDPTAIPALFEASQTLVRPGVADTQAVLARELSAGDGEAARLFRQSTTLAREAQALRVEIARLDALKARTAQDAEGLRDDRVRLADAESAQVATQAKLAAYPSYRVIGGGAISIDGLRESLAPDEGYWKLAVVGRSIFAIFITKETASAWRVALDPARMEAQVDAIRDTIAKPADGRVVTYPFDVVAARALFVALAGPAADAIAHTGHLIVEPDGAMQRLPVAVLIADDAGVAAYRARIAKPDGDPFDLRGVGWLGAKSAIVTAVSPAAFRDGRAAPRSSGDKAYLGMGENAPVPTMRLLTGAAPSSAAIDCRWPLAAWSRPISAAELVEARRLVGAGSEIETGAAFTDDAIVQRTDLAEFRILHFATHGLVTGPRPQCPVRPALLTSFGGATSDGLLTFREIYDLKLDADLVILSACDTASASSVDAARAAGLSSGGGAALDGLVRAFVGAGSRSVLASHWPAPDEFDATGRLITGLFSAPAGTGAADALQTAQKSLMQAAETSHPYYWAGFVLIGDGKRPVRAL